MQLLYRTNRKGLLVPASIYPRRKKLVESRRRLTDYSKFTLSGCCFGGSGGSRRLRRRWSMFVDRRHRVSHKTGIDHTTSFTSFLLVGLGLGLGLGLTLLT